MTKLLDFPVIEFNLTNVSFTAIKVLYEYTFSGFNYDSAEFSEKLSAINDVGISNLIALCNLLDLSYVGTHDELALRICMFLNNFAKNNIDDVQEDVNDGNCSFVSMTETGTSNPDDELKTLLTNVLKVNSRPATKSDAFTLSFSDLESTIRQFDGKLGQSVEHWITQFEEITTLTGWTPLQKMIFGKKIVHN